MLLYIYKFLVFSSIANFDQVKSLEPNIKPNNEEPIVGDAVFVDVIKNISRVNHVLQELINNYEQLQKIYKSQETVDSVYSDSETDEVFKSKQVKLHEKRTKEKATTKNVVSQKFAATQMYWSDQQEDNDNTDEDDTEDEKDNTKESLTKNKKLEPTAPTTQTTLKPVNSEPEESSDGSSDKSGMSFEKVKNNESVVKRPRKIKQTNSEERGPQAEVIFIDTHKKGKENAPKPKDIKRLEHDSAVQFAVPNKPKTRYSKVSHNKETKTEAHNVLSKSKNNDDKVKKIMYSESFSAKKIWNDIIKNKPIQLEAHNDITLRRVERAKKKNTTTNHNKSKRDGQTAVVVITNNKNKKNKETESSEDDMTMKEQLKTNVLRQAYGDACLKLVMRKCYKACKRASKASCNRVKCRSGAKTAFLTASRNGCLKEFHSDNPITTTLSHIDPTFMNLRGQTVREIVMTSKHPDTFTADFFADMTRTGYLSAACLPHVLNEPKPTLRNATPTNLEQHFNILRDRFERACQRISSDKCQNACHNATAEMCASHTCPKRLTKTFKMNCKEKCRAAYGLKRKDSDSESDTDTDTETESSTDTD